jgi:hypothetical protein
VLRRAASYLPHVPAPEMGLSQAKTRQLTTSGTKPSLSSKTRLTDLRGLVTEDGAKSRAPVRDDVPERGVRIFRDPTLTPRRTNSGTPRAPEMMSELSATQLRGIVFGLE